MPSRRLTPDVALSVALGADITRAADNLNGRTIDDDVAAIVELAGGREDLLAEAIGLHADPDSYLERRRDLAAALFALDVPGVDHWRAILAERLSPSGQHTTEGFASPHPDRGQRGKTWETGF